MKSFSIWKFPLVIDDIVEIEMPANSELMTVQMQQGIPCVWAKVDVSAPSKKCRFRWFGTGHPVPEESMTYVGTVQVEDGDLVFHLFFE